MMKKTLIATTLVALSMAFASISTSAADQFGADRHVAKGIKCEMCHGSDKANPQEPTIETCSGCHNAYVAALSGSVGLHQLPYHAWSNGKLLRPVPQFRVQSALKFFSVRVPLPGTLI